MTEPNTRAMVERKNCGQWTMETRRTRRANVDVESNRACAGDNGGIRERVSTCAP
jgi:hypothetical protein